MTTPQRPTFAQEMELLKQQRKQQADAAAAARLRAREQQAKQTVPAAMPTPVVPPVAAPVVVHEPVPKVVEGMVFPRLVPLETTVSPTRATVKVTLQDADVAAQEVQRQKQEAMDKAFAMHVGEHQRVARPGAGRAHELATMMFCTRCRLTTPGEYVESKHEDMGGFWKALGFIPGVAFFLDRKFGSPDHCTHCHSEELIPMDSDQARALCGDQHAAFMQNGWGEMRSAAREHTQERRFAIGKILVVCMLILGASLYLMRP